MGMLDGAAKSSFAQLKREVVGQELCTRCGICAGVCPDGAIGFDEESHPCLIGRCRACGLCVACCPGADADLPSFSQEVFGMPHDFSNLQGHVENAYVAHAVDAETRRSGASGGVVTALLLHLLRSGRIDGALVVGNDPERPWLAKGMLATTPEAIQAASQSKYCVVPSMAGLQEIRARQGKFAVVALPCQIHGLRKLAKADPELFGKLEIVLGLYCTSVMHPNGHLEAMRAAGISLQEVAQFHFRGPGWPGGMSVRKKDGSVTLLHASEAFRTMINAMFRLFGVGRCRLCLDGLAEFADLSFGDFWAFDYPDDFSRLENCTLVSQRTAKGLETLLKAERAGALVLHRLPANRLSKRIMSMVQGKRSRAAVYMAQRRKRDLPCPDYRVETPAPSWRDWRKSISYLLAGPFRGPRSRACLLKLLFSPSSGLLLHRLNAARMKMFARYHNN